MKTMKSVELRFGDAHIEREYIWFFDNCLQSVCRVNLSTNKIEIMAVYGEDEKFLSYHIFYLNSKIYITSYCSSNILIYDNIYRKFTMLINAEAVTVDPPYHTYDFHMLFNNKIWMFPNYMCNEVYYFDIITEKFSIEKKLTTSLLRLIDRRYLAIAYANGEKNKLYSVIHNTNKYLQYDLQNGEVQLYKINIDNLRLNSMAIDGNKLWFTQTDRMEIICQDRDGKISKIEDSAINTSLSYSKIVVLREHIIILPRLGNCVVVINKISGDNIKVDISNLQIYGKNYKTGMAKILGCKENDQFILLFPWGTTKMVAISKCNYSIEAVETKCDVEELTKIIFNSASSKKYGITESEELGVLELFDYLNVNNNRGEELGKDSGLESNLSIGEKIYNVIRKV